jgi:hypothetical protein
MSPKHIRCGVRAAAAVIGIVAASVGGYAVSYDQATFAGVMEGLTFVLLVAGIWAIVEVIVGGFERQPSAYAVAAQTVCETFRVLDEQAAEDSPKVRLMRR